MQIRPAKVTDLDFIQSCAVAAYTKYIERIGKPPAPMVADFAEAVNNATVSVIESSGERVGYVVYYPVDSEMHLENVAVLPDYHGKGFGRALIAHVEESAKACAMNSVSLYTNEAMTENLQLYPSLGYSEYKRSTEAGFKRVFFNKLL